jgi:methionyl aminopeptidase
LVGLDFGTIYQGWYGDSAKTVSVGKPNAQIEKLMKVAEESLYKGIEQAVEGNRTGDIGFAVQNYVESFGFSVVRDFVGHGIGRALHEDPQVPNFGSRGKGTILKNGMVIAIEPMVNIGSPEVEVLSDGWTVVTRDGKFSAHYEHTIAITSNGPEILTKV